MPKEIPLPKLKGDLLMRRLAREIAIDQREVADIVQRAGITEREFRKIAGSKDFQQMLQRELDDWHSAQNTPERVKIKAAAMIEEWLPEAFQQMHNGDAPLLHKTDLAKLVSRLGGMDKGEVAAGTAGERFSVTINLGSDQKLDFNKEVTSKVIEHNDQN